MKAGELLNKLATKSGIAATDKHLIELLSKSEFVNHEVPDELATVIDTALMTVEAAKSNPEVIKKIKGETLNGADSVITKLIAELGYEDADVADIIADKNTFAKIEKLVKKTNELSAKKAGAGKGDQAAIQKQIDDLNTKIREAKDLHTKEVAALKGQHAEQLTNYELINMFSAKKLALPADMPAKVKNDIVLNSVKAELTAKGFQIVNENGAYQVKKIDGTDAYDEGNRKIDLTGFIDGVIAQNKLGVVTDPNPPAPPTPPVPGAPTVKINNNALSLIDEALKDSGFVAPTT